MAMVVSFMGHDGKDYGIGAIGCRERKGGDGYVMV